MGMGVSFVLAFGFTGIAFSQPIIGGIFLLVYKKILGMEGVRVQIVSNILYQCIAAFLTLVVIKTIEISVSVNLTGLIALLVAGGMIFLIALYFMKKEIVLEFRTYASEVLNIT